ncbi:MAG: viroplasmin family protein [Tannerellaceae bacterium]|jgi:ribonuclease HI|nr:viroplasmin family protein [Tannerellaceae bacterium]
MPKNKFYVVWKGLNPGIYDTWEACRLQVEGQEDAKYKAFLSRGEAVEALGKGYTHYLKRTASPRAASGPVKKPVAGQPVLPSIAVDAACSGNPGDMEYRGVYTATGEELFHIGPFRQGTNNVGEFLALVHGLAFLKQRNSNLPVYSDSLNAIKWVRNKKSKTLLKRTPVNEPLFDLIERAEKWLKENTYTTTILKWETTQWGEIPADFGRK